MIQALQEFPEMREHHAAAHRLLAGGAAGAAAATPTLQMFCRLGYTPQPVPATPRRPLQAFVA
jgi:hypothetical protein